MIDKAYRRKVYRMKRIMALLIKAEELLVLIDKREHSKNISQIVISLRRDI